MFKGSIEIRKKFDLTQLDMGHTKHFSLKSHFFIHFLFFYLFSSRHFFFNFCCCYTTTEASLHAIKVGLIYGKCIKFELRSHDFLISIHSFHQKDLLILEIYVRHAVMLFLSANSAKINNRSTTEASGFFDLLMACGQIE